MHWCSYLVNRPRSIYQYSNMAPRLSGQNSIFGVIFFASKSLLGIERQKKVEKFAILTRTPRGHARIMIYRTWPIAVDFRAKTNKQSDQKTVDFCYVTLPSQSFPRNSVWRLVCRKNVDTNSCVCRNLKGARSRYFRWFCWSWALNVKLAEQESFICKITAT